MFESGYTIDDLLIGKVGVVGICKGKIDPKHMKSPLDYFQQPKGPTSDLPDDVIECSEELEPSIAKGGNGHTESGYYIDILAIIQAVKFESR